MPRRPRHRLFATYLFHSCFPTQEVVANISGRYTIVIARSDDLKVKMRSLAYEMIRSRFPKPMCPNALKDLPNARSVVMKY